MVNDPLAIPDFLRAFNIRKPLLDAAIQAVSKAGDEELAQKLKDISILPRFKAALTEPLVADIPTCSPNKKVRLTRKLKEDTAIRICQLIDDGHHTYARLKKIITDERVLKSSIRYGLEHDTNGTKIVKVSPKIYGVTGRAK